MSWSHYRELIRLKNMGEFMFHLGYDFTYVGNEFKIKVENRYNYIDLLLFNYEYNCFVVIELKVTELKNRLDKYKFIRTI